MEYELLRAICTKMYYEFFHKIKDRNGSYLAGCFPDINLCGRLVKKMNLLKLCSEGDVSNVERMSFVFVLYERIGDKNEFEYSYKLILDCEIQKELIYNKMQDLMLIQEDDFDYVLVAKYSNNHHIKNSKNLTFNIYDVNNGYKKSKVVRSVWVIPIGHPSLGKRR